MKVVAVKGFREFDVEGELQIGDFIRCGDLIGLVKGLRIEEPEFVSYLSKYDVDEIKRFMPDVVEVKKIAECITLCDLKLSDPVRTPEIGDDVVVLSDDEIRSLHMQSGQSGNGFSIPYLLQLVDRADISVIKRLLERLMRIIPEEKELLDILMCEVEYAIMKKMQLR
jgi:hypothetical protein